MKKIICSIAFLFFSFMSYADNNLVFLGNNGLNNNYLIKSSIFESGGYKYSSVLATNTKENYFIIIDNVFDCKKVRVKSLRTYMKGNVYIESSKWINIENNSILRKEFDIVCIK